MNNFRDHYVYNGTDILINKFELKDSALLEKIELFYTNSRIKDLVAKPSLVPQNFDLQHWKGLHGYIFQDIYEWAGEIRTLRISKGYTMFAYPEHIESEAIRLLSMLREDNYLRDSNIKDFARKSAYFFAELNIIHPFREGNGRTLRKFFSQLAIKAGYRINWRGDTHQNQLKGVIDAMHGSYEFLEKVFIKITTN